MSPRSGIASQFLPEPIGGSIEKFAREVLRVELLSVSLCSVQTGEQVPEVQSTVTNRLLPATNQSTSTGSTASATHRVHHTSAGVFQSDVPALTGAFQSTERGAVPLILPRLEIDGASHFLMRCLHQVVQRLSQPN